MKSFIEESLPMHMAKTPSARAGKLGRFAASRVDWLMCASINLLQSRNRLHARSRDEMERYVAACEKLTVEDFYAAERAGKRPQATGAVDRADGAAPDEGARPAEELGPTPGEVDEAGIEAATRS